MKWWPFRKRKAADAREALSPMALGMLAEGAQWIVCGWCNKDSLVYPKWFETEPPSEAQEHSESSDSPWLPFSLSWTDGGDTICINCDRGVRRWLAPWTRMEFFADGCEIARRGEELLWGSGRFHAPHLSFVPNDEPIRTLERGPARRAIVGNRPPSSGGETDGSAS